MEEKQKRQRLGPADQPFETDDGILAFALYLAGVPFVTDQMWCKNSYTVDMLRNLGFKGLDARAAAKAAVKANKRGNVRFYFKREPYLKKLIDLFTAHEKHMNTAEGRGDEVFRKLLDDYKSGELPSDEAAIQIACTLLKMRTQFMNGWKELPPHIRIVSGGEPRRQKFQFKDDFGRTGTGEHVSYPGFKEFSADADDETLQRLGVL